MQGTSLKQIGEKQDLFAMADTLPGGIAAFSYDGNAFTLVRANRGFYDIMGCSPSSYAARFGTSIPVAQKPTALASVVKNVECQLARGAHFALEFSLGDAEHPTRWILLRANESEARDGKRIFHGIFTDVTNYKEIQQKNELNIDRQKREAEQLKERSRRDPLTGFYNKVVAEEIVEAYLSGAGRNGRSALMVIDIDNFKTINDALGHLFGDAVLLDVSAELRGAFRASDVIGRVGGDEFVVFLKDVSTIEDIRRKAGAICEAFRGAYSAQEHAHRISCSIGVSLYPDHGKTYRELFAYADEALYAAKSYQKDNFVIFGNADAARPERQNVGPARGKTAKRGKKLSLIRIFELLFDTQDVARGVQMVLRQLGEHYQVDRVYIMENACLHSKLNITYEWCRAGIASRNRPNEQVLYYALAQEKPFCCVDTENEVLPPQLKEYYDRCDVRALLQCSIQEGKNFAGTIGFDQCGQPRKWTAEEIESIIVVAKFIGSYLVKMRAQTEIEKLAYTDTLTGMWNLNKFKMKAEQMLSDWGAHTADHYAMICFDVKKFRYINDTFGFEIGDEILSYIARQLKKIPLDDMIFTRMTADKFLILVRYATVEELMQTLRQTLRDSQYYISAQTGRYKLVFNCGIYLMQRDVEEAIPTSIDKADIARSEARSGHDNTCVFYSDEFRRRILREKEIEDMVDTAIARKEFVVYYQPKIDLMSGKVKGAEALVRWMSPIKGFMSPNEFIPLFEKNGFIAKLDFYVFETVYVNLRRWLDEGRPPIPVSVNMSRIHLSDSTFIDKLVSLSEKYRIPPHLVEIELTESVFMDNTSSIIEVMGRLKSLGFMTSIDDFGSGYSSLRLLRDLPVDYLKLDKEFLDNGDENRREQIIIMNVIRMAKTLGIKVVSEGVETSSQETFLKSCSCDLVQGFLYAKPMPVSAFEELEWN